MSLYEKKFEKILNTIVNESLLGKKFQIDYCVLKAWQLIDSNYNEAMTLL
jgi:hypothetical protein